MSLISYLDKILGPCGRSTQGFNTFFKTQPLSCVFNLGAFNETHGYFHAGDHQKAVYELTARVGIDQSAINLISESLNQCISDNLSITVTLMASGDTKPVLDKYLSMRQSNPLAVKRANFFKGASRGAEENQGVCSWTLIVCLSSTTTTRLSQSEATFVSALESTNFMPRKIGPQQLIEEYYRVWRILDPSIRTPRYEEIEPLSSQLSCGDIFFNVENSSITWPRLKKSRSFYASSLPSEFSLENVFRFLGDSSSRSFSIENPIIYSWLLFAENQESSARNYLVSELRWQRQAASPMGHFIPKIHETVSEFANLREKISGGSKIVQQSFAVTIFSDHQSLDIDSNRLKNYFSTLGITLSTANMIQMPVFLSHLAAFFDDKWGKDLQSFGLFKTLLAEQAAQFMPLQGEWNGSRHPQALFNNRQGGLCFFDPFDKGMEKGNFNISVTGKSGSGKSNLMAYLILERLLTGGQAFVIDVGYSYKSLGNKMGATQIEFSKKSNISLNPFSKLKSLDSESLLYLKPLLSKMCYRKRETSELEDSLLEKAVRLAWNNNGSHCTLLKVSEALESIDKNLGKTLAQALYPFSQGVYSEYFNGPSTIDFSDDFIIFELEELKDKPDLREIVMLTLIFKIQAAMYRNRNKKKYLVVDEAWQLLGGENTSASSNFLENTARRIRKFNGSLIVGTQGLDDFFTNKCGEAIFYNSDWLISLAQKDDAIDRAVEKCAALKTTQGALKSVRTVAGKYSEAMIKSSAGYVILRLYLNEELLKIFSTDAEDLKSLCPI